jgi:hypothetical protein
VEPPILHPLDEHLGPRTGAALFTAFGPFRPGSRERALTDITIHEFNSIVEAVRRMDPARVDRMLRRLRAVFRSRLSNPGLAGDVSADVVTLRASLPADLWARYFADIPRPRPHDGLPTGILHGGGRLGPTPLPIEIDKVRVSCAQERPTNRLTVRWGAHRFDLDLLGSATCIDDPAIANPPWADFDTHRGMGIGRYNGAPGAVADWTLVNRGPGVRDSVVLTIREGKGGEVVLRASGSLQTGNLWAVGRRR